MKSVSNLKKWVDDEYAKVDGDPWGLEWRPSQKYRYSNVIESINRQVESIDLSIADIGCATGIFTNYIHRNFNKKHVKVVGVDISTIAIERARENYPELEFAVSDIKNYSESYIDSQDIVICLETLYYVETDKRSEAISQLASTLKPNGLLVISSLNEKAPYLSKGEIIDLLSDFNILEVSVINVKPLITIERLIIKADRVLRKLGIKINILKNMFRLIFSHSVVKIMSRIFNRIANRYTASHILVIAQKSN